MNNSELWNLSGYIHKESFFQSQLKTGGVQKSKYMERYQRNYAGSKRSNLYVTLFTSLFLLIYAFLPVLALFNVTNSTVNSTNIYDQLFSNAFLIGTYFLFNFIYYFLIGFLPMMEFLQGKTFKYLRTLPLTSTDIQKVTIFTVIRMNGIQIAVIIFTVPVVILIMLKNLLLVSVILIANILNAMFIFYLFIVVSNFLSYKVFNAANANSKLFTIIRISVSLFYIISMFGVSYLFEFIPNLTQISLLTNSFGTGHSLEINILSSLIIFPVSSGYAILFVVIPTKLIPTSILIGTAVGMFLFIAIIFILLRKGNRILSNLAYEDSSMVSNKTSRNIDSDMIKIKVSGPKVAYIKRLFIMATREQGKLVIFILPILFPLIFAISYKTTSSGSAEALNPFFMLFFYFAIIPYFLNNGLSQAEEGLGGLLSILPIKNRDIFRAKQYITIFLMLLSSSIYILIVGYQNVTNDPEIVIKIVFLSIILPGVYLLVYSLLFGKVNNHYTSFKVNTSNSAIKNVINIGLQISLIIVIALIMVPSWMYLLAIDLVILLLVEIIIRILIR